MKISFTISETETKEDLFDRLTPEIKKMLGEATRSKWEIELRKPTRTMKQNRALHKFFSSLAETLNRAGLDMRKVIKVDVEILWSAENIKNFLWRPVQKATFGKESTAKLSTKQVGEIYEILNRHLGEKFGIHEPFPDQLGKEL